MTRSRPRASGWGWYLFLVVFSIYVVGGGVYGYAFFTRVREAIESPFAVSSASAVEPPPAVVAVLPTPVDRTPLTTNVTSTPILSQPSAPGAATQPTLSVIASERPPARRRINILLMGLDQREFDASDDPGRTDTMIVATIDEQAGTAALLSIPRDLWVQIPTTRFSVTNERITAAHTYGALEKYPDGVNPMGGPELARRTVELNLGINIHFWARIDFQGFVNAVDRLGGVWVDVDHEVVDNAYPTDDYGVMSIFIPKGRHLLDGRSAMQFARSRHSADDVERGLRQRQVLLGLRQQALNLSLLPELPNLIHEFQGSFATDISIDKFPALANLASKIEPRNVRSYAIDFRHAETWITPAGAQVLIPRRERIAELVNEVFYRDPLLQRDGARVGVYNGSGRPGIAGNWSRHLQVVGFRVAEIGDADRSDYTETVIIDRTADRGLEYSINTLRARLGLPDGGRVRYEPKADSEVDLEVILGADMPYR